MRLAPFWLAFLSLDPCSSSVDCRKALPASPGPSTARTVKAFCSFMHSLHGAGLSPESLYVDVGADGGQEFMLMSGYSHPVITFECRLDQATRLLAGPFWTPQGVVPSRQRPSNVHIVHSCVADRNGLAELVGAIDSSSMMASTVPEWKALKAGSTSKMLNGTAFRRRNVFAVPTVTLDHALSPASLQALGEANARVGFIKIDAQGLDSAVLRGATRIIAKHLPLVLYEDTFLPESERYGNIMQSLLAPQGITYTCGCDLSDCFCAPLSTRPQFADHVCAKCSTKESRLANISCPALCRSGP